MTKLFPLLALILVSCGGDKESPEKREVTLLAENDSLRTIIGMGQSARHRTGLKLIQYLENDTVKYHIDSSYFPAPPETVYVVDTIYVIYDTADGVWLDDSSYQELLDLAFSEYNFPTGDSIYEVLVEVCDTTWEYYWHRDSVGYGHQADSLIINCHWDTVKVKLLTNPND